jgi:hypothetical protein
LVAELWGGGLVAQLTMPRAKITIKPKIKKFFIKHLDLVLNYPLVKGATFARWLSGLHSNRVCITPNKCGSSFTLWKYMPKIGMKISVVKLFVN